MRLRTRMVAAGMALGMMAGVWAVVPAPATAATTTPVTLTCLGADANSQAALDMLGQLATPKQPPPVSLSASANVTANVPANLDTGGSAPVSFGAQLVLPQSLIDTAVGFGITSIGVSNLVMGVRASGGGTGGPFNGAPTSFTINLSPLNVPTISASGTVNITDASKPTLFAVVDPVTFTVAISLGGNTSTINLTCAVPAGTYVGAINGSIPAPPTTIATTTTAQAAAVTQPRFTG